MLYKSLVLLALLMIASPAIAVENNTDKALQNSKNTEEQLNRLHKLFADNPINFKDVTDKRLQKWQQEEPWSKAKQHRNEQIKRY